MRVGSLDRARRAAPRRRRPARAGRSRCRRGTPLPRVDDVEGEVGGGVRSLGRAAGEAPAALVPRAELVAHLEHELAVVRVRPARRARRRRRRAAPTGRRPSGSASAAARASRKNERMVGRQERRRDRRRPSRCRAGSARARASACGSRRRSPRSTTTWPVGRPCAPLHPVPVDRVAGGPAAELEHARSASGRRRARRSGGSASTRCSHQLARARERRPAAARASASQSGGRRLERLGRLDEPHAPARSSGAPNAACSRGTATSPANAARPYPKRAVDRLLRGPQRRERLAALVRVVEVGAHHRAQDAAAAMGRRDADDGRPRARDRSRPGTESVNANAPAPPTIASPSQAACIRSSGSSAREALGSARRPARRRSTGRSPARRGRARARSAQRRTSTLIRRCARAARTRASAAARRRPRSGR